MTIGRNFNTDWSVFDQHAHYGKIKCTFVESKSFDRLFTSWFGFGLADDPSVSNRDRFSRSAALSDVQN